jgi:hypothetical protein
VWKGISGTDCHVNCGVGKVEGSSQWTLKKKEKVEGNSLFIA